ncbi:hypothetical protein L596_011305 [Steinernema carpocapsae]|uniref:Uncharacterized protein n=1 Tax=Steinernema carpocapsae TaxID=34508 RepID=A0A4U5NTH1_STECR|nr:hypothetical protein L596_011305 [Steinernema carpocapsae]
MLVGDGEPRLVWLMLSFLFELDGKMKVLTELSCLISVCLRLYFKFPVFLLVCLFACDVFVKFYGFVKCTMAH